MESRQSKERFGYGKGIQGRDNSCYLDTTIMSLFYGGSGLDDIFLLKRPQEGGSTNIIVDAQNCIKTIVGTLRNTNRCSSGLIEKLRRVLYSVNTKMVGEMMDVEEFVATLCKKGLNLGPFINYEGGTGNYFHQILLPRLNTGGGQPMGKLQSLLELSLRNQSLIVSGISVPFFLIKMPRANGQLIGYSGIIPPLTLKIPLRNNTFRNMNLQAVITIRYCHYTCFIRSKQEWVYFDSMAAGGQPEVIFLEDMEKELQILNSRGIDDPNLMGMNDNDTKSRKMLSRLTSDIHFCIYALPQVGKEFGFKSTQNSNPTPSMPTPRNPRPVTIPQSRTTLNMNNNASAGRSTPARNPITSRVPLSTPSQPVAVIRYPVSGNHAVRNASIPRPRDPVPVLRPQPPIYNGSRTQPVSPRTNFVQPQNPSIRGSIRPSQDRPHPQQSSTTVSRYVSPFENFVTRIPGFFTFLGEGAVTLIESAVNFFILITHDLNNSMPLMENLRRLVPEQTSQIERIGENKGFESDERSSFELESILFALFSNTRANDGIILQNEWRHSSDNLTKTSSKLLGEVVDALRYPPYLCSLRTIANLKTALATKCPTFRENIDVDEALCLLFRQVFPTTPFIQYVNSGGFIHQLILPPLLNSSTIQETTESAFYKSMSHQKLLLAGVPNPQLILKIPKNRDGNIVGSGCIVPSLTINLGPVQKEGRPVNLHLYAIICAKMGSTGCYAYVTYVKWNADQSNAVLGKYCWVKMVRHGFISSIKPWPKLEKHLKSGDIRMTGNFVHSLLDKDSTEFKKLCETVHLCFYSRSGNYQ